MSTEDSMSVRYVFTELSAFCQQRIPCRSNNYVFKELSAFCQEMLCRWIMSLRNCPRFVRTEDSMSLRYCLFCQQMIPCLFVTSLRNCPRFVNRGFHVGRIIMSLRNCSRFVQRCYVGGLCLYDIVLGMEGHGGVVLLWRGG